MVLQTLRRTLHISRDSSPAPSSLSAPPSRPSTPLNLPTTKSLSRSSSRSSLFSRTPKEPLISPYSLRAPVAPTADMSLVTIHTGPLTFQHPRALLEFGSVTIKRQLMAEGIASDLKIEIPECLEPSAVKSAFDILVSKTGGWELNIKAPTSRSTIAPASPRRMNASWSSSSVSSRSTKSSHSGTSSGSARSATDKEASLWYIQLFEVGRYLASEAVCNIAISGYRRGRRALSVRSHIYRDIDALNARSLWGTALGSFVKKMLAFEARGEEGSELPEWIEQLLEDAPCEVFEGVREEWEIVRGMGERASIVGMAGWEDWVDPCTALGCLWHEHKETKGCVGEEEVRRWRGMVEGLMGPGRSRNGILSKARSY